EFLAITWERARELARRCWRTSVRAGDVTGAAKGIWTPNFKPSDRSVDGATPYHFQSCAVDAPVAMSRHLVPDSFLTGTSAPAILRSGWGRQDVLGRKAPGTWTLDTVRGGPLAPGFQRAQAFERSRSLVRDGPARHGEGVTHRVAVVHPPAQVTRQRASVTG